MQDTVSADPSSREMELIRSAYRTMAARGSQRMSLQDVANDAGVSKALLLYHFGSKDALLFAAMKWALDRTAERIREGLDAGATPQERISSLIDAVWVEPEANREFYLFYLDLVEHAGRVPGFDGLSEMLHETVNGLYAEVIAEGVADGVFDVPDVEVAARHMRALIEGTFLQWIQTRDWAQNHQDWKKRCREELLRILGTTEPDRGQGGG